METVISMGQLISPDIQISKMEVKRMRVNLMETANRIKLLRISFWVRAIYSDFDPKYALNAPAFDNIKGGKK